MAIVSSPPRSATFRSGEQENLLIADNRTDDWRRAAPEERRALAARAWGGRHLGREEPGLHPAARSA